MSSLGAALATVLAVSCQTVSPSDSPAADSGDSPTSQLDGEALYVKHCAECHGSNGQGMPEINSPAIGGRSAFVINSLLKSYRTGKRGLDPANIPAAQMRAAILAVSPEESKAIAKFVSGMDEGN